MIVDAYTILSINDERKRRKDAIRQIMRPIPEAKIDSVDGTTADIESLLHKRKITSVWGNAKRGEIGVWLSVLNACQYAYDNNINLLVFEDDAIIQSDNFVKELHFYLKYVPDNCDAFSVLSPENQHVGAKIQWIDKQSGSAIMHTGLAPVYDIGNPWVCRAYQTYSFVSMIYTPHGGKNILDLSRATGLTMPIDCWLFEQYEKGELEVYTLTPDCATLVDINWDNQDPTTIHGTGVWSERETIKTI